MARVLSVRFYPLRVALLPAPQWSDRIARLTQR